MVILVTVLSLGWQVPLQAETAYLAVASNFAAIASKIGQKFEQKTKHHVSIVIGSTGKLYAQILNGAPYDLFMSADSLRPELLETDGQVVIGSRFTYAIGDLVLWSQQHFPADNSIEDILTATSVRRIAIPNPKLAPFGVAAEQTLTRLGIVATVADKLVYAENVGQAFSFVATKNADIGFVASSNLATWSNNDSALVKEIPVHLFDPIRQDVVLLKRASSNIAAIAFMEYLQSEEAQSIIANHGYQLAPP